MSSKIKLGLILIVISVFTISFFQPQAPTFLSIEKNTKIALVGGNLGSRMINYDHFETELHLRYPENNLMVRNMCDGGDTPGFRPHSARFAPWAFPGAEKFQSEFANPSQSEGHIETHDQWMSRLKMDVVIGLFGYSESYEGKANIANYKAELEAFIMHTLAQKYNGVSAPQLAIVSPTAFENLSAKIDLPNGTVQNANMVLYAQAMKEVCEKNNVLFINAFDASKKWYAE